MSAGLVSTLRARPQVVRLGDATSGGSISLRVQIPEVWDVLRIEAPSTASILEVKRGAIAQLLPGNEAQQFVVKLRGNEVLDETVTLADSGVRSGSTLLITSRRRRPVR